MTSQSRAGFMHTGMWVLLLWTRVQNSVRLFCCGIVDFTAWGLGWFRNGELKCGGFERVNVCGTKDQITALRAAASKSEFVFQLWRGQCRHRQDTRRSMKVTVTFCMMFLGLLEMPSSTLQVLVFRHIEMRELKPFESVSDCWFHTLIH